jgi:hypothetical protein
MKQKHNLLHLFRVVSMYIMWLLLAAGGRTKRSANHTGTGQCVQGGAPPRLCRYEI